MPLVVLDTVIFVRSLLNHRSRWGRLVFDYSSRYELAISPAVIAEIIEVLQRPELRGKFRTLDERDPRRVLDLLTQAHLVDLDDVARSVETRRMTSFWQQRRVPAPSIW